MKYLIYVKSHCDYPDYEDECEAKNKAEAVNIFLERINRNNSWTKNMIENFVVEENE